MIKQRFVISYFCAICIICAFCIAGCGQSITRQPASVSPPTAGPDGSASDIAADDPTINGETAEDLAEKDHEEIRALLEKGLSIRNLSYTAQFNSDDNELTYEFYKRDNLTKMVIQDGDTQSISVSDGKSTVYYSLPDKIGYTMLESGDDMGIVPSTEALLNEAVYHFRTVGEEPLSGFLCQVVETEDEFGILKIWISKTMGLPIKYIGTDDIGWYSLTLTEIQLGEPPEGLFAIPSDVAMIRYDDAM